MSVCTHVTYQYHWTVKKFECYEKLPRYLNFGFNNDLNIFVGKWHFTWRRARILERILRITLQNIYRTEKCFEKDVVENVGTGRVYLEDEVTAHIPLRTVSVLKQNATVCPAQICLIVIVWFMSVGGVMTVIGWGQTRTPRGRWSIVPYPSALTLPS